MGPTGENFERFVRANSATLYRTAFLLAGNRVDAEELLQDTLAHLYPKWARVCAADVPLAYVRRALGNRYVSARRSALARHETAWELPERWDGQDLGESVAVSRTVWQLLGNLPPKQRTAVVLRYFHDLPDADVAEVLGCRQVTVRSLVSRGLAAMRGAYLDQSARPEGSVR